LLSKLLQASWASEAVEEATAELARRRPTIGTETLQVGRSYYASIVIIRMA
jgi:hypothetical protein